MATRRRPRKGQEALLKGYTYHDGDEFRVELDRKGKTLSYTGKRPRTWTGKRKRGGKDWVTISPIERNIKLLMGQLRYGWRRK